MWRDLRFTLRTLVRQPLLAIVVIATIALGIGGSTAVFSVVNAVLIRDLPYPDAGQIYVMRAIAPDGLSGEITRREFARIYEREEHPTVETAAIVWSQETQIVGTDQRPHPTVRYGVTDRFFEVFGPQMVLGRGFERGENPGHIVISFPVWRDVFDSDPDIVGKIVAAEGSQFEVVGVTPASFDFPEDPGFWYLMRIGAAYDNVRAYRGFMRLRPGRTQAQIEQEVARLAEELGPDPVTGQQPVFVAEPFLHYVVGDLRATVLILFGATGILLLIAAINVTNLLLSRTTARAREVALREAVGAGRWRIIRQLVTETLALVIVGGAIGVAVAAGGIRLLLTLAPVDLPRLDSVPIDRTVLLFALGLTVVTGVLVGLAPAWRLSRNELRTLINESGRGTPGGAGRNRVFSALVLTEVALAVVLVIGAALLVRSYVNLTMADPGFNPARVVVLTMNIPGRMQMQPGAGLDAERRWIGPSPYMPLATFLQDLEERLRGVSGIESVAVATSLPLARKQFRPLMAFTLPDRVDANSDSAWTAPIRSVSRGYFDTMAMRILSGRGLARSDGQGAPGVAVVNETFARRFFPDQAPLGQRIRLRENRYVPTDTGFQFGHMVVEELEVVGVVADAKYQTLAQAAEPAMYVSSDQFIDRRRVVLVRTSLDSPAAVVAAIRQEIAALDPLLAVQVAVYDDVVQSSMGRERLGMTLLTIFGGAALLLAAIGIYGLMSYSVAQRTGEMAVRAAMGASAGQILGLVMRHGVRLAVGGIALGAIGAVALRQVMAGQLYGVSPLDAPVFLLVTTALFAVAMLACFVPARRAMSVDPADLLRAE